MNEFASLILTQLTIPPGDLIYYIVLAFAVASALQSALNHWRVSEFPQAKRAFAGLSILLGAQILMFVVSGLGWQQILEPRSILPPLDRAFILFGIVWITWLYAFPEPNRLADSAVTLLSLLIFAILGFSLLSWQTQIADPQFATLSYNQTIDDWFWQIGSLFMVLVGIAIMLIRRPDGRWNGVTLLFLGLLGHAGHLFFQTEGNYSGIVRLAYIAAYPILLTLPQRFAVPTQTVSVDSRPIKASLDKETGERRRYSTDPKTFHAMLTLAAESNPTKITQAVTRAIAQTMLSDLCFMIYLTDNNNQLIIAGGYDLIREDSLEGGSLNKGAIPMLANSLQRGRPLRMPASSTSADIKGLGDILGLTNPGHLLCVPILTSEKESMGGILLLSPYSDRTWTAEDQAFLSNIATSLVPIIKRSQNINKLETQAEQARTQLTQFERQVQDLTQQLETARAEIQKRIEVESASQQAAQEESLKTIEQLRSENSELRSKNDQMSSNISLRHEDSSSAGQQESLETIEKLRTENAELRSKIDLGSSNISTHSEDSSSAAQQESLKIIEQLKLENAELRSGSNNPQPTDVTLQLEKELKASLQEVARLQNQLADANIKTREMEKEQMAARSTEQAEVVASISQELRQPLSSIVGYTDLLLGESVGILGALQRKFVERIKASTERIRSLTDDMIQITTLETELNDLKPESVDLNSIIDNAMSYTSTQVREKNISIHLELPKTLNPIQADREALQQILIHLLQNAGAATPFEGSIRLKVQTQSEENLEYILIQVADSGGGIASTDLPRVFTRLYRADNVLIQGVGDTGVGLSITKTLTEAHHGRIWVESEQGVGSTFSVLLPISGSATPENNDEIKGKK